MRFEELKEKALSLPLSPGVYIMKDKSGQVIYVGKAKKLKNRVCQYFQDTASHTFKTRQMVSKIDHFDFIVASTEFEALVLECSLIKRYQPKYNILLKDDKGYPLIRLNINDAYPTLSMVNKVGNDGAEYFGPFGSRHTTSQILSSISETFKLPGCSKKFPRDIGKSRPCLNYHMDRCSGWCQDLHTQSEYRCAIEQARQLLLGNYKQVVKDLSEEMLAASEDLNFELAARLRDRMKAVESLGKKQIVTAGAKSDLDVVGFATTETKACFAVLHFRDGALLDKDYEILSVPDDPAIAVSSLIKQYYLSLGFAPKLILLPLEIDDSTLFEQLLQQETGRKITIKVPQRGDNTKLVAMANRNAMEECQRITDRDERIAASLALLGKMLAIAPPMRIESYDISNISGTDIVAGMVVFQDGKAKRSDYKRFKIQGLENQDDYASMQQVLLRRFRRYLEGDTGFSQTPDLLLIDGGAVHAKTVYDALADLNITIPVFGMVKDNKHRTRALVTPDGKEISIDTQPSVFALIGTIQEETHRFAITYHRSLRSKRLKYSELDKIPGIGPKRKQDLIKAFQSIKAIRNAELYELEQILSKDAAYSVYSYFQSKDRKGEL